MTNQGLVFVYWDLRGLNGIYHRIFSWDLLGRFDTIGFSNQMGYPIIKVVSTKQ